jgi:carbamoyltransferase
MTTRSETGWILGLNPGFGGFNYHDPSAVLVHRGRIVAAAEEERFTRRKGAAGIFPAQAVRSCLAFAGITLADLDEIAVGYSPTRWRERIALETSRAEEELKRLAGRGRQGMPVPHDHALATIAEVTSALSEVSLRARAWQSDEVAAARLLNELGFPERPVPVQFVEHHLAHVASAYYPSDFEEATALVFDGVGEVSCSSVWHARNGVIRRVRETLLPNSLGYFYAAVTQFLGFQAWEGEGKLMALAAYGGHDETVARVLGRLAPSNGDTPDPTEFVVGSLGHGLSLSLGRAAAALEGAFRIPPRSPEAPLTDQHRAIAWGVQDLLERTVTKVARQAVSATGAPLVCAAGGVFLNCKLNMVLRETPGVEALYVQPVAGDAGVAIGSALYRSMERGGAERAPLSTLALGPETPSTACVAELLRGWRISFEISPNPAAEAAEAIARGDVVFWYSGRAELGPRALGRRSILADPRDPAMRDRVNLTVKSREVWRPFSPSILEENAHEILEGFPQGHRVPYMIQAYRVRPEWRARIPAVVHPADHTARPQTVGRETDGEYHALIQRFAEITGVPVVLNTSLNDRGEPVANSPRDAVRFFFSSGADLLVLGGCVVRKSNSGGR